MEKSEKASIIVKYFFLYETEAQEFIDNKLMPQIEDIIFKSSVLNDESIENININRPILLYASDNKIKELLEKYKDNNLKIAVLPHPKATEICAGMGVDKNLSKAVLHLKTISKPINTDVLYCNGKAVFNNLIIGQSFNLSSEDFVKTDNFFKRVLNHIIRFFKIRPFLVDVEIPNKNNIKTAVAGIVVSEHRKSSFISRLLMEDSSINDGKMHAFLLSPRSIVEMFYYGINSIWQKSKIPPFGAHIKTSEIKLSFPNGEKEYVADKVKFKAKEIELKISKNQFVFFPGSHLSISDKEAKDNEIFKLNSLPSGETAKELAVGPIPFIRHASTDEFKDLFQLIRENAKLKSSYLVLMVLSTILATFGLFANSVPVVIGAMILAPLMSPIISLSMGTLRQDRKLISQSFVTIASGMTLSVLFAVLITWLTPLDSPGSEILSRTRPHLLDLGIAVVSGIAGAYAHAREEIAKTLAGVAIAVALVPPLAVAAIGIGWGELNIFVGAFLLLITNLAGMVLAASLTFMYLGFSSFKLARKGILISLLIVVALSIPLSYSFNQMLNEHKITQKIEKLETENIRVRNVKIRSLNPTQVSLTLVSNKQINDSEILMMKNFIESEIGEDIQLEVITAIAK